MTDQYRFEIKVESGKNDYILRGFSNYFNGGTFYFVFESSLNFL